MSDDQIGIGDSLEVEPIDVSEATPDQEAQVAPPIPEPKAARRYPRGIENLDARAYIASRLGIEQALADRILARKVGRVEGIYYLTVPFGDEDREGKLGNSKTLRRADSLDAAIFDLNERGVEFDKNHRSKDLSTAIGEVAILDEQVFTEAEETREWVESFRRPLSECDPADTEHLLERITYERQRRGTSLDEGTIPAASFVSPDGTAHIAGSELKTWVERQFDERVTVRELTKRLRNLGFYRHQMSVRDGGKVHKRWYSISPEGFES
jgi:hypothetical protein